MLTSALILFATTTWIDGGSGKKIPPVLSDEGMTTERILERIYESGSYRGIDVRVDPSTHETQITLWEKVKILAVSYKSIPAGVEDDFDAAKAPLQGQEYTGSRVAEFEDKLNRALSNNGYFNGKVVVVVKENAEDRSRVSFVVDVDSGPRTTLVEIRTNLHDPALEKRVLKVMGLSSGGPINISQIERAVNDFPSAAARENFFKPRIKSHRLISSTEKTELILELHFEPIRIFDFSYRGDLGDVNSNELSKHISEKFEQLQDVQGVGGLTELYFQGRGYLKARVEVREFPTHKPGTNRVELDINAGKRVRFEGFRWSGVEHLDAKDLSGFVERFGQESLARGYYSRTAVDKGVEQLPVFFKNHGLFRARIQYVKEEMSGDGSSLHVNIHVLEGMPTRIRRIDFSGLDESLREKLTEILRLKEGELLNLSQIETFLNELAPTIQQEGYFYARSGEELTTKIVRFSEDYQFADIVVPIQLGPKAHFGKVSVFGVDQTRAIVVLREIQWKEGDAYDKDVVDETRAAFNRTGLFRSVRIEFVRMPLGDDAKVDHISIPVEIYVDERKAGTFEMGAGVRSDDGFKVFTGIAYRNLGGMNRTISSRIDLNAQFPNRFEFVEPKLTIGYVEPWVGPFPVRFRADIEVQKADEPANDFVSGKATTQLIYYFTKNIYLKHLLYEIQAIQRFNIRRDDGSIDRYIFENDRISVMGPTVTFDFRDDTFNPTDGWFASIGTLLSAPEIGSNHDIRFFQMESKAKGYYPFTSRLVGAMFGSYGYVRRIGDNFRIPREYLFYLGGRTSLRSYGTDVIKPADTQINFINDSQVFLLRSELRFNVWDDFGLAAFWDGGALFVDGADEFGFRQSLGMGLRYKTPVGPFALDFAYTVDGKPEVIPGEKGWRIHFSVGVF